jgi:hypothetical protein
MLLLFPVILLGIIAACYWEYTELIGQGDLRLYAWSQGMPVILILLLVTLFPSRYSGQFYVYEALLLYAIGRLAELMDKPIYYSTDQLLSGHTINHLAMAAVIYSFVRYLKHRRAIKA